MCNLTTVVNAKASLITSCYRAAANTATNLHAEVFVCFKYLILKKKYFFKYWFLGYDAYLDNCFPFSKSHLLSFVFI